MRNTFPLGVGGLVFALLFFQRSVAIDPGQLGIQANDGLARSASRRIIFGSITTILGLNQWTDQQIVDLAFVAHADAKAAYVAVRATGVYGQFKDKNGPSVTTTLVVGSTAYIATSMKGGAYLYMDKGHEHRNGVLDHTHPCDGPVQDALLRCQANTINSNGHRTGAACGEAMAALAFCATQSQQSLSGAKIVSIIGNTEANFRIVAPCGAPRVVVPSGPNLGYEGEWGCHSFVAYENLNIQVIPVNTERTATYVSPDDISVAPEARYP